MAACQGLRALDLTPRLVKHHFQTTEKQFNSLVSLFSRESRHRPHPSSLSPSLSLVISFLTFVVSNPPASPPRIRGRVLLISAVQCNIVRGYRSINSKCVYADARLETKSPGTMAWTKRIVREPFDSPRERIEIPIQAVKFKYYRNLLNQVY